MGPDLSMPGYSSEVIVRHRKLVRATIISSVKKRATELEMKQNKTNCVMQIKHLLIKDSE